MKNYHQLPNKNSSRITISLPLELYNDISSYADSNARKIKEEIIVRLIATLVQNEEFMSTDRLMRLIFSKKLAYEAKLSKSPVK